MGWEVFLLAPSGSREKTRPDSDMELVTAAYRHQLARVRLEHRQEAERLAAELAAGGASIVILFGSVAQGTDSFSSDIDLVAVSDAVRDIPFHRRTAEALARLNPSVHTDLLIYTPEEWEALRRSRRFVRDEMWQKGVILYERS
jgi:predicted nucleotidyltransferase